MDRQTFVTLGDAMIEELAYEMRTAELLASVGISYERANPTPLQEAVMDMLIADEEADIDLYAVFAELAENGSTYIFDREVFGADDVWDVIS